MTIDPHQLVAMDPIVTRQRFTRRDTILYALGVGAGHGGPGADLSYVFEDVLQALPTMASVLAYPGFWLRDPRYGADWRRVLHGEQRVTVHRPLPVEGEVRSELVVDGVADKGADKGAVLFISRRITDEDTGAHLATVEQVSFLRGDGGCGDAGTPGAAPPRVPDRPADQVVTVPTRPEQALIYRLFGDDNPLHVDPDAATAAGMPRPILHGLSTFGFAGRAVLRGLCADDARRLRTIGCRFTSPLYPGETLQIELWNTGAGNGAFRVRAVDRDCTVLDHGHTTYEEVS